VYVCYIFVATETVSIFASNGDFHDIKWESEAMAMSRHFEPKKVHTSHPGVLVLAEGENPNDFSISSLYKCVKVCGCGEEVTDDISTIDKEKDQNK
jgi:hypothetical protein